MIEPAAAEMAARHAEPADIERIEPCLQEMKHCVLQADLDACCRADVGFHAALLHASHNIIIRQLIGTISATLGNVFRLSTQLSRSYAVSLTVHEEVLEAVRAAARGGVPSDAVLT